MITGRVGKQNSSIPYLFGYAAAGSLIQFYCIYDDAKMQECSNIINLEKLSSRATMIIALVNIVRIARTLVQPSK
ncbi:hypothetical protein GGF40_000065 [Coemansia sp. RSA 1286]|nr:hypothetical protein GGF39_000390 [Coemansia sp. RSA 1721]KAJ2640417.1 hypothetical protein GGF40_000065 [Coemansia sp. RSA 1286]